MHSQHALSACTHSMCSQHALSACTLSMHSQHVLSCARKQADAGTACTVLCVHSLQVCVVLDVSPRLVSAYLSSITAWLCFAMTPACALADVYCQVWDWLNIEVGSKTPSMLDELAHLATAVGVVHRRLLSMTICGSIGIAILLPDHLFSRHAI